MRPAGAASTYDGSRIMPGMDQIQLRNRLLVATGMWRETTGEPLPKMPPGDPATRSSSSS